MAKKASAAQSAKPARAVKTVVRKPSPKGHVRNFYLHAVLGDCQDDGTVAATKTMSNGPWSKMGGFDLEIYQRASALNSGAVHVMHIEARAYPDGRLTMKVFDKARGVKLLDAESFRDGVPEVANEKK